MATTVQFLNLPAPLIKSSKLSVCGSDTVTLRANGCPNGATVVWSNGMTGASIVFTPTATATYYAICQISQAQSDHSNSLMVNVRPVPTITGARSYTTGQTVSLTATAAGASGYTWKGPNGYTSTGAELRILGASIGSTAGSYTVTASYSGGGCSPYNVVVITVNGPVLQTGTLTQSSVCQGAVLSVPFASTGSFGGSNSFTIQLSDMGGNFTSPVTVGSGSGSPISVTIPAGTIPGSGYRMRVVSSDPLTEGTVSPTLLTVTAPPSLSASSNSPAGQISLGDTLRLTTTGQNLTGATYLWNGPNGYTSTVANPVIPNSTTANNGTYTITATTPSGCTATAQTSVSLLTACRMSYDGAPVASCDSAAADSTRKGVIWVKLLNVPEGSTLHITLYQQTTAIATASSSPVSFTGLPDNSYRVEDYAITGTDTCQAGSRTVTVDCDNRELNIRIKSVDATPTETDLIPRVDGGLGTLTLSVEELDGQDLSGYTYLWTEPISTSATTSTATTTTLVGSRIGEYKVTLVKGRSDGSGDTLVAYTTLRAKPCKQVAHTYNCGHPATPVGNLDDTGISNLAPGDTIRTGDFDVIVTEIIQGSLSTGGSGGWTGRGYTQIPYLGDTQIAVDFTNATVNDCYEYTGGGTVQSAYDASWGSVADLDTLVSDFEDLLRNTMVSARYLANNFDDSQSQKDQAKELSEQLDDLRQQITNSDLSASDKQEALSALDQLESGLTSLANGNCSPSGARLATPLAGARVASAGSCVADITTASDRLGNLGLDIGAGLGAAISPEVAATQLAKFKLLDWSKSVVDATGLLDGSAIQLTADDLATYNELVDNINQASADKIQIVLLDSGFDDSNLENVLKKGELASLIPPIFENVKRIFIKIDQTRRVISSNWGILNGCHEKARAAVQNEDKWDFKLIGYATKFIKCITDEDIANYFSNGNSEALFSAGVVNAVAEDLDVIEVKQAFNNAASQASQWAKDVWSSVSQGKIKKAAIEQFAKPLLTTSWSILEYLVNHASNDLDDATNRFKTSPYFRGRVMGKLVMFFAPFADATKTIKGSTETLEALKGMLQRKNFTLKPSSSNGVIIIEEGNTSITIRQVDELLTATSTVDGVGVYTTRIDWNAIYKGSNGIRARPFPPGYWGERIEQISSRVNAYELKINPNNESFYLPNGSGGYKQFEGFDGQFLKDGKCVGCNGTSKSIYFVESVPYAQGNVLNEARGQVEAAKLHNLKVEWLVSDQGAIDELNRFFIRNRVDIKLTYLPE